MSIERRFTISYGKMHVPVYRVYARPLTGIRPIPESGFTGRENILFAYEIDVEVSATTSCQPTLRVITAM